MRGYRAAAAGAHERAAALHCGLIRRAAAAAAPLGAEEAGDVASRRRPRRMPRWRTGRGLRGVAGGASGTELRSIPYLRRCSEEKGWICSVALHANTAQRPAYLSYMFSLGSMPLQCRNAEYGWACMIKLHSPDQITLCTA